MARYTQGLIATLRQRYEDTDQFVASIAAEFEIGTRTLQKIAAREGWRRRRDRARGLPIAVSLLEEAKALAAGAAASPPPERGRSDCEAVREGVIHEETPTPTLPLAGGGSPSARVEGGEQAPSAIDRIEALVVKEIETEESARARLGGAARKNSAERRARTLATLTQTLHALQRLRAGKADIPEQESHSDDDMPRDIDEFRRDLARRIDAFVASRTDAADAGGDSGTATVDEAG